MRHGQFFLRSSQLIYNDLIHETYQMQLTARS